MAARDFKRAAAVEVHAYAVDHWLPDDKGPGIELAFTQDGADGQLHVLMSHPLAWAMASKILALLNADPITPDDPRFEEV
jgi:hypothetical protein